MDKTPQNPKKSGPAANRRKPAPYIVIGKGNLFGWLFACFFICGCMFFLGVMVGRNTAPVQFDVDRLAEKLSRLPASVLKAEADTTKADAPLPEPLEMPVINDAIIDHLKDRHNPPEIYEQYIPPVLTPKYAKTPPKEKPAPPAAATSAPEPAPAPAVAVLTPEIPKTADAPAPEITPISEKKAEIEPPALPPERAVPESAESAFAIQVASLQDAEKARMLMSRFQEKGYPAFCQSSQVDGVTWHRVRIGPYPDRTLAARDQERLKAAGVDSLVISMHQNAP